MPPATPFTAPIQIRLSHNRPTEGNLTRNSSSNRSKALTNPRTSINSHTHINANGTAAPNSPHQELDNSRTDTAARYTHSRRTASQDNTTLDSDSGEFASGRLDEGDEKGDDIFNLAGSSGALHTRSSLQDRHDFSLFLSITVIISGSNLISIHLLTLQQIFAPSLMSRPEAFTPAPQPSSESSTFTSASRSQSNDPPLHLAIVLTPLMNLRTPGRGTPHPSLLSIVGSAKTGLWLIPHCFRPP